MGRAQPCSFVFFIGDDRVYTTIHSRPLYLVRSQHRRERVTRNSAPAVPCPHDENGDTHTPPVSREARATRTFTYTDGRETDPLAINVRKRVRRIQRDGPSGAPHGAPTTPARVGSGLPCGEWRMKLTANPQTRLHRGRIGKHPPAPERDFRVVKESPASGKCFLASGGCDFGKTRPWLGLVDLTTNRLVIFSPSFDFALLLIVLNRIGRFP